MACSLKRSDLRGGQVVSAPGAASERGPWADSATCRAHSHPNITADASGSCHDSCRGGCASLRVLLGYFEKEICQGIMSHLSQPGALWERICAASRHRGLFLSGTILSGATVPESNSGEIQALRVCLPCIWSPGEGKR